MCELMEELAREAAEKAAKNAAYKSRGCALEIG